MNFLDINGLSYFWNKVKTYISQHSGSGNIFPVGSVYLTTSSENPGNYLEGTWSLLTDSDTIDIYKRDN